MPRLCQLISLWLWLACLSPLPQAVAKVFPDIPFLTEDDIFEQWYDWGDFEDCGSASCIYDETGRDASFRFYVDWGNPRVTYVTNYIFHDAEFVVSIPLVTVSFDLASPDSHYTKSFAVSTNFLYLDPYGFGLSHWEFQGSSGDFSYFRYTGGFDPGLILESSEYSYGVPVYNGTDFELTVGVPYGPYWHTDDIYGFTDLATYEAITGDSPPSYYPFGRNVNFVLLEDVEAAFDNIHRRLAKQFFATDDIGLPVRPSASLNVSIVRSSGYFSSPANPVDEYNASEDFVREPLSRYSLSTNTFTNLIKALSLPAYGGQR